MVELFLLMEKNIQDLEGGQVTSPRNANVKEEPLTKPSQRNNNNNNSNSNNGLNFNNCPMCGAKASGKFCAECGFNYSRVQISS